MKLHIKKNENGDHIVVNDETGKVLQVLTGGEIHETLQYVQSEYSPIELTVDHVLADEL